MTDTQKAAKGTDGKSYEGFTEEERAAMKERAKELKSSKRRTSSSAKVDGETSVLEKIAEMPDEDRVLAERLHAIVMASAPELTPKLWYGMPAYAKDGKVLCFVQCAAKFKSRYLTFGFDDTAMLDEGTMWPTAFAVTKLTSAEEELIGALVKKAVS